MYATESVGSSVYDDCNEKPKSTMEKLRKDGVVVETLQITNFIKYNRRKELGNYLILLKLL
jgi:hypothetical protein